MSGSATIFQPLHDIVSVSETTDKGQHGTHRLSQTTTTFSGPSSSITSSTHPASTPLSPNSSRPESQQPTVTGAPHSRQHRLSLASLARDKTSSAFANLASRSTPAVPALRTSSSISNLSERRAAVNAAAGGPGAIASLEHQRASPPQAHHSPRREPPRIWENTQRSRGGSGPSGADQHSPHHQLQPSSSRNPAFPPGHMSQGSFNKMHSTSSRLLRMTDEERPFTRDFKDLFSTLMVSLPLTAHRVRLQKIEHTFTSDQAISNLGSLKFSQSNRMPDPKDPSRIVTTTTTTTFSMAKEMARSVCQRFLDARFIEPADGKMVPIFPLKGAIWQLTPKGMHILQRFCQRNGINQRHVLDVLESARNTMQLVILEREAATDKLNKDGSTIEVIFRRFAGQDGPNVKSSTSHSDSDSLSDYHNGLVGVKMARERTILDKVVPNTFTGKAAVDWLMDCCETVDGRETFEVAELFVTHGLIEAVVEDKAYAHGHSAASTFQPTKNAIYKLTEKGQLKCGWVLREKSNNGGEGPANGIGRDGRVARDSNNNRLNLILQDPALRLLFGEFLRETHCQENLEFYVDVKEFNENYDRTSKSISDRADKSKSLVHKQDAIRETYAAAYGLYNMFLAPGSPCELNIDHNLRNSLASRMTQAVGDDEHMETSLQEVVDLFEAAQHSVFKLMSSDSVPKFLKEPRYASVLRAHNLDHVVAPALPLRSMSRSARDTRP